MKPKFKYIYGPVASWRLGNSLGIDLLPGPDKICNFNCIYCQLGSDLRVVKKRKSYVPTKVVIQELAALADFESQKGKLKIDYITFSGQGEPTLASNLGEVILAIKSIRKEPIAVLTNSLLIEKSDIRKELGLADFVIAKLDAASQALFSKINRPAAVIRLEDIIKGIKEFRQKSRSRLGLQIMFIRDNIEEAAKLASIVEDIRPDEVQLNTPLRSSPTKPLSKNEMADISRYFKPLASRGDIKVVSVYEGEDKEVFPISDENALRRRGKI